MLTLDIAGGRLNLIFELEVWLHNHPATQTLVVVLRDYLIRLALFFF